MTIGTVILLYLIVVNLAGFIQMGVDKRKAIRNAWRIPEARLFLCALLGGSLGSILGMYTFRHKTKKLKFTIGFPTILILEVLLIIYFIII